MDIKPMLASRLWQLFFWLTLLLFLIVLVYALSILSSTINNGVLV